MESEMPKLREKPEIERPKEREPELERPQTDAPELQPELDIDIPDELRRRDQPEADVVPPRSDEEIVPGGRSPLPDGGVEQHPVHDEPMEDFGPDDYEHLADEAEERFRREERREERQAREAGEGEGRPPEGTPAPSNKPSR
jgi:hypothetical protein